MATTASTTTYTTAHTATYLSDAIFGAMTTLLDHLGLGAAGLARRWPTEFAPAIKAWMQERALKEVVLECTKPSGAKQRFDFEVVYTEDSGTFRNRARTLAGYYAKIAKLPAGSSWQIFCTFHSAHTAQPGWSPTTLASAAGSALTLGTLARAPHAQVGLKSYQGSDHDHRR